MEEDDEGDEVEVMAEPAIIAEGDDDHRAGRNVPDEDDLTSNESTSEEEDDEAPSGTHTRQQTGALPAAAAGTYQDDVSRRGEAKSRREKQTAKLRRSDAAVSTFVKTKLAEFESHASAIIAAESLVELHGKKYPATDYNATDSFEEGFQPRTAELLEVTFIL